MEKTWLLVVQSRQSFDLEILGQQHETIQLFLLDLDLDDDDDNDTDDNAGNSDDVDNDDTYLSLVDERQHSVQLVRLHPSQVD